MNCFPPEQDFSQLDKMERDKLLGIGQMAGKRCDVGIRASSNADGQ
jgi:hypothetical protein